MSCCSGCESGLYGCESDLPGLYGLSGLNGLMGELLTAGSRVLFQAETEGGILDTDSLIEEFRRFLSQRGLTIENITWDSLGLTWSGARMIRVWAQVVTPIDRAQEADLQYDMTVDLQRASNAPIENAALQILVRAEKDPRGRPVYPGGRPSLPNILAPDAPGKSIFDEIAEGLNVTKGVAQALAFGGLTLLLILVAKR